METVREIRDAGRFRHLVEDAHQHRAQGSSGAIIGAPTTQPRWICAQLGAREHYAIPRALDAIGALDALVTEFWGRGLRGRYHAALDNARVISGGLAWSANEAMMRARHRLGCSSDWGLILSRNARFDRFARRHIGSLLGTAKSDGARALFAYSYACTTTLEVAADRGCRAVMGQIDGGPVEEQIVLDEMRRHPELKERYRPAPARYWHEWRRQCSTANRIVVNSPWARECLERAGVDVRKAVTVPLYFEPALDPAPRPSVQRFDDSRRLEVLFLGQLNLRKGAARLFDAIRQLRSDPVRFTVVGPALVQIPDDVLMARNFSYVGRVERADVGRYYEAADVMILPTLSDGFALTQLEAQAHQLPIIASAFCGEVVTDGVNGLVLPEVTGDAIACSIRRLIAEPGQLALMRSRCVSSFRNIREYGERLVQEAIG